MVRKKSDYGPPLNKRQRIGSKPIKFEGSNEEVLLRDVEELIVTRQTSSGGNEGQEGQDASNASPANHVLPERFTEIEVKILKLSSTGDGLGLSSTQNHIYVVPFSIPGDVVKAKVFHQFPQKGYTLTDFIEVLVPSPQRNDSLVKCTYFSKCAGCQLQMLSYNEQLKHKKTIIEKAYLNFSTLRPELIPEIGETVESPLQYGYRTKLTPHFNGPPGSNRRKSKKAGPDGVGTKGFEKVPPIGFMVKGTRTTIDIEDCPIGTKAVRLGMAKERERVARDFAKFERGSTLLLRENTSRTKNRVSEPAINPASSEEKINSEAKRQPEDILAKTETHTSAVDSDNQTDSYTEVKTCITDQNAISTEYVDDFIFLNPAGSFFQNNNSILSRFTAYIRAHILPPNNQPSHPPIQYLIDAYCGSGLFTITLSSLFLSSTGIDIAQSSITHARINARHNNVPNASFITADAPALFQNITYPPDQTVVIIDPPRKGCDDAFLQQLLRFGPMRVVYVSCNVHTQARDVGVLVEGSKDSRFGIESIRGFDFFPQTGHVEGVAVLKRLD